MSAGGLPGPQSSGKGLGMAGRDDVLNCWSSCCRRLQERQRPSKAAVRSGPRGPTSGKLPGNPREGLG